MLIIRFMVTYELRRNAENIQSSKRWISLCSKDLSHLGFINKFQHLLVFIVDFQRNKRHCSLCKLFIKPDSCVVQATDNGYGRLDNFYRAACNADAVEG